MKIKCSQCGTPVSTDVPDNTVIRAWIECPECIEKENEVEIEKTKIAAFRVLQNSTYGKPPTEKTKIMQTS